MGHAQVQAQPTGEPPLIRVALEREPEEPQPVLWTVAHEAQPDPEPAKWFADQAPETRQLAPEDISRVVKAEAAKSTRTGRREGGAYVYADYTNNHVVWPGRDDALRQFVKQRYGGRMHKYKHAHSSNSEDALSWSCFDCLAHVRPDLREMALRQLWELAFDGAVLPDSVREGSIFVGKTFGTDEKTEVDAGIDGPRALVFMEAKLYSAMSQADEANGKPYNQIARKLRVGIKEKLRTKREFYFIIVDLAPPAMLSQLRPGVSLDEATRAVAQGFRSKWLTAYWFMRYKAPRRNSTAPLAGVFGEDSEFDGVDLVRVQRNMGWLCWADVFKIVLRAIVGHVQAGA